MTRIATMLALILTAAPAGAADLWCMPDRICRGTRCLAPQDEESSLRLVGADSARPVLRGGGEEVPMRAVRDGASVEWRGRSRDGGRDSLEWRRSDGFFVYRRVLGDAAYTASGRCEVQ